MKRISSTNQQRAVLYIRVSTADQSTENQRPALLQLAEARGFEVIEVVEETASALKQRAGLDRILEEAHQGRFNILIVWGLDRLGRSMVGNLNIVLQLDKIGVQVISLQEPWLQMDGAVRSLLIAVFSWIAEQERNRISERTKAGLEKLRKKGVKLGRPRANINMTYMRQLRAQGMSIRAMAKKLGIAPATTHKLLKEDSKRSQKGCAKK